MYNLDVAATQAINHLAGECRVLDFGMIWISAIGVPILVLAVAIQWWRKDARPHVRHVLLAVGISFLVGLALNQLILLFVQRPRPYAIGVTHLLIAKSTDPSFPSDHATASASIAFAFLLHGMRKESLSFLAAAVVIMVSRIYIGTHYVSDVAGGTLTAFAAAALVRLLFREGTAVDRMITGIF